MSVLTCYHNILRKKKARNKYLEDKAKYIKLQKNNGGVPILEEFPQYYDYEQNAGAVDGHYFMQDIHVAELISKAGTKKHYDIGSKIDYFIAHLLSNSNMDEVIMLDIRPFPYNIPKLSFFQTDATNLDGIQDESIESISSLHAIEHFGLGRYGDTVNPLACFDAMSAIQRVTAPGGTIYISVPVSKMERCCFNAHRVFLPETIVSSFYKCDIKEISFIKSKHVIETYNGEEAKQMIDNRSYELGDYDCGIFVFVKK